MNNSISRFLLAFVAFAGITLSLSAASPNLGSVLPRGAQRGTEVEVTFTGARLEDAKELLFYKKGIETTKLHSLMQTNSKPRSRLNQTLNLANMVFVYALLLASAN